MIDSVLVTLRPGAKWSLNGDTYEGIQWLDEKQTKPTKQEVLAEIEVLKANIANQEYQRLRADEYPSIKDQLDMQYHDAVNGTTTWQDAIQAVKDKYPKV